AGTPNGDSVEDNCGICDSDGSNDCVQDCSGAWGGSSVDDECGICGGDNSTCTDCNNELNGLAIVDGCGDCVNGNTGEEPCPQDCAGVDGGDAARNGCDTCICNSSVALEGFVCSDSEVCIAGCDGFWYNDGLAPILDYCNVCDGDNSTCADCANVPNGDSFIDNCSECVAAGDMSCVQGCNGNYANDGTQIVDDECGVCDGDNSTCLDCAEVPNGDALVDMCETCDDDPSNDCVQDCNFEWGGGDLSCLSIENQIPENFSINKIYPNPFNPVVNIEYSLATSDLVNISIYDLNGQMVDQLFSEHQTVGNYHMTWDASEMSSGIYLITIQSGNILLSDQLILLK
ncbi:MAG: T9SS type A sorting domain-containing protein, partial [Candidatus Marinimicrobia bacterium]|nr:T9SS type A sorting domain-containing protein [Candidatus Neomarinimicrobiota bacterium]